MAGYLFYTYGMALSQAFNGAGDTRTPTKINFIVFWIFQLPFAYLVAITFEMGALDLFLAITLAEILLSVIAIFWFRKGHWKRGAV